MRQQHNERALAIIFMVAVAHLPLMFLPSVNLEFAFVDATRYLETGSHALLDEYFSYQANSLGFPILAWLAAHVFPTDNLLLITRGLNVFGIILFGLGVLNIAKYLDRQDSAILLLLLLVNPLVWIFSARGTADFLPAALAIYAVSLWLNSEFAVRKTLTAGVLFGIAVVLKYHVLSLVVFVAALALTEHEKRRAFRSLAIFVTLAISVLGVYLITAHSLYGFWLTPPKFQAVLGLAASSILNNFVLYAGYSVLLCIPVSLIVPRARQIFAANWKTVLLGMAALFLLGNFVLSDRGEMNFGPLDRWLNRNLVNGAFLLLSAAVLSPLFFQSTESQMAATKKRYLGFALVLVLAVFGLSRPAQRYLLPLLPFYILALPTERIRFRTIAPFVAGFLLINVFIGYSQWCTGSAAREMASEIAQAGLMSITDPGAIEGHVGDQFFQRRTGETSYTVLEGAHPKALITVKRGLAFASKSYSLVPAEGTSSPGR